jgi:hypothetical protein
VALDALDRTEEVANDADVMLQNRFKRLFYPETVWFK